MKRELILFYTEEWLNILSENKKIKAEDIDYHLYIQHHIIYVSTIQKRKKNDKTIILPVYLSYEFLKKIIPEKKIKIVLDNLLELNLISKIGGYQPKFNAQRYIIKEQFIDEIKIKRKKFNNKIEKKINKYIDDNIKEIDNRQDGYSYISQNINKLDYDNRGAKKSIYYQNSKKDNYPMNEYLYRVDSWKQQTPSICRYNRLHHPLTSTSKDLRKFITYNGKKLQSIDISNSQPFFLAVYLSDLIEKNNSILYHEYLEYKKLVTSGQLYEVIGEKIGLTDRNIIKTKMFAEFFYARKHNKNSEIYQAMTNMYPNLSELIFQLNEVTTEGENLLAHKMQRVEGKVIYDFIKHMIDQKIISEQFIITLHDSFVTTDDELIDILETNFIEYMKKEYDIVPNLKREKYN